MAVHHKIEERLARGNPPEIKEKLKTARACLKAREERALPLPPHLQNETSQN